MPLTDPNAKSFAEPWKDEAGYAAAMLANKRDLRRVLYKEDGVSYTGEHDKQAEPLASKAEQKSEGSNTEQGGSKEKKLKSEPAELWRECVGCGSAFQGPAAAIKPFSRVNGWSTEPSYALFCSRKCCDGFKLHAYTLKGLGLPERAEDD